MSSRGIRRSISTGMATCASRDAWTEAARSSAGSAGPLDSLLLPFRKRGPLRIRDSVHQPENAGYCGVRGKAINKSSGREDAGTGDQREHERSRAHNEAMLR